MSKVLTSLSIVGGIVLNYRLCFRAIYGEFVQTHEGTHNGMTHHTIDAAALGPNGNVFSLVIVRMLQ